MARFNAARRSAGSGPVRTAPVPVGVTYEGAPGYARDAKSELFLLAVAHLADASFYESAPERDQRFADLVRAVTAEDPRWMARFVPWLRDGAGLRTAAVVAAAEAAKALLEAGQPGGRQLIADTLRRADEPGELLAYWVARHGRAIPKPVKRGIGDATFRLLTEYPLLKYDTGAHAFRFADVLALVHAGDRKGSSQSGRFRGAWQRDLFGYAVDRRYGRDAVPDSLLMVAANQRLRAEATGDPSVLLDSDRLREAGMTWEDALSLAGSAVPKRELWTALVPLLGYLALLRNLRNLDEAGVPDDVAARAAARLADPEQVRRSRVFPFRFLAAYRAVPSLRWAHALEQALSASLASVPRLTGRTLILVDRSGSMFDRPSAKSGLNRADTAAVFGTALALRAEQADLVEFGTGSAVVPFRAAEPVLKVVHRFGNLGGTNTAAAVAAHFRRGKHARAVIVTDEQAMGQVSPANGVPGDVPLYTWNLAGYRYGHAPSGGWNRHALGGLTDRAFGLIPMIEAGQAARWDDLFDAV
jgi:TROVE domain-containing protein